MMRIAKNILFPLFLLTGAGFFCRVEAQTGTGECNSISTQKIMLLRTPWSESENAASLTWFGCESRIGSASVYSEIQDNEFHRFQEGDAQVQTGFVTDGFVKYGNWKFYGNFNYYSQSEQNTKWVGVMNPYGDNPYTMGDSIGGEYSKEYFKMQGKGAYRLNQALSFGFDVKYTAGVGAKRKDPRPENTITSFSISPGIIAGFGRIKLGANFRYESGKEDIEVSAVTEGTYYLFHFKGLGVYSSTPEYDYRVHIGELLGGGFQLNFSNSRFDNLTEIGFYKKSTDIKRGETYPLQVALLEKFNTEISSTFVFSPSGKISKKLRLFFSDKHLYGHEPVVEPKQQSVTYQWSTAAKYTLYWHSGNEYGFDYSYYNITGKNSINWGARLAGKLNSSETTYYFVPEYNRQRLNILDVNAEIEKGFQYRSGDIVLSCNGGYRKGLDGRLELTGDGSLLSTVNTGFVTRDFDYYNAGLMLLGASLKVGKNLSVYGNRVQAFIGTAFKTMISDLPGNPKSNILEVKLGMSF